MNNFYGKCYAFFQVVEVISTMLQRNSRCKLSSDDVTFLQRPGADPDKVLQFTVNIGVIHYLQAVAFYLRQNLLQIPLITPNYMNGCKGFRDCHMELSGSEESGQIESDVYLYNEANPRYELSLFFSKLTEDS